MAQRDRFEDEKTWACPSLLACLLAQIDEMAQRDRFEDEKTWVCPSLRASLLAPIDDEATRSRGWDANGTLRLAAQPLECALVVTEETLERSEARSVVLAQPLSLLLAEHVFQHHTRLDGNARQPLESEPALIRVGVPGVHVTDDKDGLNANTKFIVFICRVACKTGERGVEAGITYSNQARW